MTVTLDQIWPFVVGIAIVVGIAVLLLRLAAAGSARIKRASAEMNERMEALFRASFPELQPHFHPARVHQFVRERIARKAPSRNTTWRNPPGFPAAAAAEIELDGMRDKVRLVDAAGAKIVDFIYEEHAEGGVIRLGKGKFTVNVKGPEPRVRYWHPEREFKWTPGSWKMGTKLADQSLESSDTSSSYDSSSSSSSSSSISRGAATGAAAGGIIAAGGTFDGGGASAAWDEGGGGGGGSSSGSDSSPDFSSVDSGSSSSSTSY